MDITSCPMIARDLHVPHPHGARVVSKINSPPVYRFWLDILTLLEGQSAVENEGSFLAFSAFHYKEARSCYRLS
jgi:hypothetical protein